MRIKLDENIPVLLVSGLTSLGHDVDTVQDENLTGHEDEELRIAAQRDGRFLITQDLDFSDLRRYQPGTHFGLLLVRLAQPGRLALVQGVATLFATEAVDSWRGCIVVATEHKLRIRRPN